MSFSNRQTEKSNDHGSFATSDGQNNPKASITSKAGDGIVAIPISTANPYRQANTLLQKEDRVALAKERMDKSKRTWISKSIEFDIQDKHNKYIGCVTKRIGVKHINKDIPCQDSCLAIHNVDEGLIIVAIADGHGDASHDLSEHGSKLACEILCHLINTRFNKKEPKVKEYFTSAYFKTELVSMWKDRVLNFHRDKFENSEFTKADIEKIVTRYGTTLLFAFAFDGYYVVGQLGDGGIVLVNKDDAKCRMHKPLPNKKIGGGTASLCMNGAEAFMDIKIYPEEECFGIVLMTDGYYDPWSSDESLFKASRFFVDTLISNKLDKEGNIALAYNEKYNEVVDYADDDISIGILTTKTPRESIDNNIQYIISRVKSSCTRTIYTLFDKNNKYKGIYSKYFSTRELPSKIYRSPLQNIIFPCKELLVNNLRFYLYNESSDERLSFDDYCEMFIVSKKYPIGIIQSINIVRNILKTINGASKLFEDKDISVLELSDMIEFSITDESVVFYWAHPTPVGLFKTAKNLVEITAKYILNFLAMGKLFYGDKTIYKPFGEDSFYEKNLNKYPQFYKELLFNAINPKSKVTISSLLNATTLLRKKYVCCSNCRTVSFCDEKNHSCTCGKIFKIFAVLKKANDDIIIPLSANTVVSIYDSEKSSYKDIIEIIENSENKTGFKNISGIAWSAKTEDNKLFSIEPNKVKDASNCIALTINDEEYVIENINGGNQYG